VALIDIWMTHRLPMMMRVKIETSFNSLHCQKDVKDFRTGIRKAHR
jgi:hypothetical protein